MNLDEIRLLTYIIKDELLTKPTGDCLYKVYYLARHNSITLINLNSGSLFEVEISVFLDNYIIEKTKTTIRKSAVGILYA